MIDLERFEKKFLIGEVTAARIAANLALFVPEDPHNGFDGYPVRTVYFDTPADRDFEMKLAGLDERWKIRLRTYEPEADSALLELKEKRGMTQRKRSLRVPRAQAEELLQGRYGFLLKSEDPFLQALGREMEMRVYRPRCVVTYRRTAYGLPDNNTRITFDREVAASESSCALFSPSLVTYPVVPPGGVILEVKYSEFLLTYVKRALGEDLLLSEPVSKYCMARQISKHGRM